MKQLLQGRSRSRQQASERRRLGGDLRKFAVREHRDINVPRAGKFTVSVGAASGRAVKQTLKIGIVAEVEFSDGGDDVPAVTTANHLADNRLERLNRSFAARRVQGVDYQISRLRSRPFVEN